MTNRVKQEIPLNNVDLAMLLTVKRSFPVISTTKTLSHAFDQRFELVLLKNHLENNRIFQEDY